MLSSRRVVFLWALILSFSLLNFWGNSCVGSQLPKSGIQERDELFEMLEEEQKLSASEKSVSNKHSSFKGHHYPRLRHNHGSSQTLKLSASEGSSTARPPMKPKEEELSQLIRYDGKRETSMMRDYEEDFLIHDEPARPTYDNPSEEIMQSSEPQGESGSSLKEEDHKRFRANNENDINNREYPSPKPQSDDDEGRMSESELSEMSHPEGKLREILATTTTPPSETGELRDQQEKLLLEKLMLGYERDVRPVKNASQPVLVQVGITLTQIFDMDEKQQVLTTNVWLDQEWNDELLRWDPSEFGGVQKIRLPCDRIWLPDIVLYNNADDYTRGYMPSRAMVAYDGTVFWPPPTKFRSTCVVDVTYFPFDDQVCTLKLGSWIYNGFEVDVTNASSTVDLSNYVSNGEWDLVKAVSRRNVVTYSCCPEPFPDVTITLVIRRKTLYYIYNIVLPCIMLSSLTLLVFCLPPDSGEKIGLGVTVLLAFSVFMLAINESLPETSESIPLIGVYLTIVMAITSVSVVMTVVVLNLHYLGPEVRPVPQWLMCLLPKNKRNRAIRQKGLFIPAAHREPRSGSLKRGGIFITQWRGAGDGGESYSIEVPPTSEKLEEMMLEKGDHDEALGNWSNTNVRARRLTSATSTDTGPGTQAPAHHNTTHFHPRGEMHSSSRNNYAPEELEQNADNVLEELLFSIKHLINKQQQVEAQNNLVAEWRLVAQVVDRILFWIFFTFTSMSSAFILLALPIYKRSWYGSPLRVINDTDITEPIEG